jgi:hypothetical protein
MREEGSKVSSQYLLEERSGAVFGVAQAFVQHFHDRQTRVETDEVGQHQRTHRHACAQLHCAVDVLACAHALHHTPHSTTRILFSIDASIRPLLPLDSPSLPPAAQRWLH